VLAYDLFQTPHHCSWHSLSYDSWSDLREKAEISKYARAALSQIRRGGAIVASSDPILDDDQDPPCYGAKLQYKAITEGAGGTLYCTGEYPSSKSVAPLEFSISDQGLKVSVKKSMTTPNTLLRPATVATGLSFPDKPVVRNKPAGFA
jgi:hypothetical protein